MFDNVDKLKFVKLNDKFQKKLQDTKFNQFFLNCSSIDTTAAWKKLRFILSVRSDFHMIKSQSTAVHAFISRVSMSFSVDETLLPR